MTEKQDRLQIASVAGGTDIARSAITDPVTCGTYVGRNGTMWDTRRAAVPQLSHRRSIHSHTFSHIRRPRSHVRAERDPERRPSGERQRSGKKGQRMERSGVTERVETGGWADVADALSRKRRFRSARRTDSNDFATVLSDAVTDLLTGKEFSAVRKDAILRFKGR